MWPVIGLPVLMTLCLRRMMSVYVPSVWNFSPNWSNTWLNLDRLPVLTATNTHIWNEYTVTSVWVMFDSRLYRQLWRQTDPESGGSRASVISWVMVVWTGVCQGSLPVTAQPQSTACGPGWRQIIQSKLTTVFTSVSVCEWHRPSVWSPQQCVEELSAEHWSEFCELQSIPTELL